jgi:isopentenyl diphosphate isomerase/L-lactate dehydrogenase-like FMN-dependent dehydrogenase
VGDKIDVMMDGGVRRGTHVLKALSLGAKAVGVGRYYLFPLAAAGQAGVEQALSLMRTEIERDMKLMGCSSISQLVGVGRYYLFPLAAAGQACSLPLRASHHAQKNGESSYVENPFIMGAGIRRDVTVGTTHLGQSVVECGLMIGT